MQYLIFEDHSHFDLRPLTYTRPLWDLRVGITRIHEKWAALLPSTPLALSFGYLAPHFSGNIAPQESIGFNAKFLPNTDYIQAITEALGPNTYLTNESGEAIAFRARPEKLNFSAALGSAALEEAGLKAQSVDFDLPEAIRFPADIFQQNRSALIADLELIRQQRKSEAIPDAHSTIYGRDNLFVEVGARIKGAILDAEDGPIYIGRHANIQPGAILQNSHAILDHATVGMGAKMRGDTTVGPWSKVGGEIGNSVIQGYSNKGHDGYLGNSVLGYWCNLGADTNTSNLKNNYTEVKIWNYPKNGFRKTGTIFCGLIMGDHSKCGINTMFNTGTVVGVSANIFGSGYPRNFVPSFSWGGAKGFSTYRLDKASETAKIVMARRKIEFSDMDQDILAHVFEESSPYRRF